ncbi:MAG: putative TetR-family transcriptional regulator [Acidimicrobiales bacterium]|nr:putative TetR-family transcriptional regulator [Acidimicrobiales bacterium]
MKRKGEATRQAILNAATVRFGRDGYRATSIADIARDASVGGTLAYAYFSNKEALFRAALDEDAAAVIQEGVSSLLDQPALDDWLPTLMTTLVGAIEGHPLARRVLAGLEPDVTPRVLDLPALEELRRVLAERLRDGQLTGATSSSIDPATMANGVVAIVLSLLMSVVQLGLEATAPYQLDVAAVLRAALSGAPHDAALPSPAGS